MFTNDMNIMLSLDLDFRPSALLVGEEDAPVDFEWSCEVIFLFLERVNLERETCIERI
jgi:hypothetical protein